MSLNQTDREALERAIELARGVDAGRRQQIDSKLADEPWEEVAHFAAYSSQIRTLSLMPWQKPPCWATLANLDKPFGDPRAEREAAELLRRLLEAGLSKYEPDPIAALNRAEVEKRQTKSSPQMPK